MELLGREVKVIVEKKRIKNIYFRINDNGEIYVTCPKVCSMIEINRLLNNNVNSLEKMYEKYLNNLKKEESVYYLGKKMDFVVYKKVMIDDNYVYGPSVDVVNDYLEKNSLGVFQERLNLYVDEFDDLPKFRLRVRNMKTRWGVCNIKSMTVTLNTLLIHKEPQLIDYVICHELSHFKHMNHSAAFWAEVSKHFPNYKEARRRLKD